MGEMVEFASNGSTAGGYLARPAGGRGPGVIVIQEWWGLVPHIEEVCDRFAAEGFFALAPDLYHGKKANEPDEAAKAMMAMSITQAGKDLSGAVDELRRRSGAERVGVVGFCMGGGLALVLAAQRPDAIGACVPFYGVVPWEDADVDWTQLRMPVLGHFAELDHSANAEWVEQLERHLREEAGNPDVTLHVYAGADHAFFNNERPEVYKPEAAQLAWERTLAFLRQHLS